MSIIFNDNIRINAGKALDAKFGPYISITEANNSIPLATRHNGLIFGVYSNPSDIPNSDIIYYHYFGSFTNSEVKRLVPDIATQQQTDAGTDDSTIITPLKLKTLLDNRVGGFSINIGNNINTSFALSHGLDTKDVIVAIYENSTEEEIITDVFTSDNNTVTITFIVPPTTNQYRVVIKK